MAALDNLADTFVAGWLLPSKVLDLSYPTPPLPPLVFAIQSGAEVAIGGAEVAIGGAEVAIGGAEVAIGGAEVAIGGVEVAIGGAEVAIGGAEVAIGGAEVAIGGAEVAIGGAEVAIGDERQRLKSDSLGHYKNYISVLLKDYYMQTCRA